VDTAGTTGFMAKHVTIHSNDRVAPTTTVTVLLTVKANAAGQK
jgi:hypothetical protein